MTARQKSVLSSDRVAVRRESVEAWVRAAPASRLEFDLVFMDPPYARHIDVGDLAGVAPLLRPHGIRTQVYPVKGYSVTVPIVDEDGAPVSTMMDEKSKVAITRLGDRIRAAGTAELTGYNLTLSHGRCAMLFHIVRDLFPKGGDLSEVKFWTGLRPMIPDGGPLIGPTRLANLYLNTGHGTLGWTMGPGSGRILADLLSGRAPEIPLDGLTIDRFPQGQGI